VQEKLKIMFEVWLGSEVLDLGENPQITFEESNPMFKSAGELGKIFTYPRRVPASDPNKRIFEFAHVVGSVRGRKAYAARVVYNGVTFAEGELILLEKTPTDFEISLQVKRRLAWAFDRKMSELYEVGWVSIDYIIGVTPRHDMTNEPFMLQINGKSYRAEHGSHIIKMQYLAAEITADGADTGIVASYFSTVEKLAIYHANPNKPFIVRLLANSKGAFSLLFTFTDSSETATINRMLAHANAVNSNPDNYDYCYPPIMHDSPDDAEFPLINGRYRFINKHNGTAYTNDRQIFSAQLRVGKTIEKIAKHYGWTLDSEWLATTAKDLCLFNNHACILADIDTFGVEEYWLYAHKLPDITLAEFLNELQKLFFLYIDFDYTNQKIVIEPMQTLLKTADTQVVTHYAEDYSIGEERFKTFRYEYNLDSELQKKAEIQNGYFSYEGTGVGETVISAGFPFLPTRGRNAIDGTDRILNYKEMLMVNRLVPEKDRPKHLFIFEKKGNTPTGTHYTDLIHLQWKSGGVGFNITLGEDGEELGWEQIPLADRGLYTMYGLEWDKLMRESVEVERELYLTTAELLSFEKTNLWRIDHANYWLVRLNYTLSDKPVERHKVKAVLRIYNGTSVGSFSSGGGTGGGGSGGGGGVEPPPLLRRNVLFEFYKLCLKRDLAVEFYEGCAPTFTVTIDLVSCE
jgi:hypothetical protein